VQPRAVAQVRSAVLGAENEAARVGGIAAPFIVLAGTSSGRVRRTSLRHSRHSTRMRRRMRRGFVRHAVWAPVRGPPHGYRLGRSHGATRPCALPPPQPAVPCGGRVLSHACHVPFCPPVARLYCC
jgi:hypothetical protein